MSSIWSKNTSFTPYPPLEKDINADVCVIGGGMAGILTAYMLSHAGYKTVVVEAARVGSGQTAGTTAKIHSAQGVKYSKLEDIHGREAAGLYARANCIALSKYWELSKKLHIDCSLEKVSACTYALTEEDELVREYEAAKRSGLKCALKKRDRWLPFDITEEIRFDEQAQFHPLRFLKAVSGCLTIYENTPAIKVEGTDVICPHGTVKAEKVVFATHYPFVNFPGMYFMRMYQQRSYVIALENAPLPENTYLGAGEDRLSFRRAGDLLLMGGGSHRTGDIGEGSKYAALSELAAKYFPNARIAAKWSAQDCITPDELPYIGKYASSRDDWYVATGFGKWGMTLSMVSAMLITDMIRGKKNDFEDLFAPSRFALPEQISAIAEQTAESVKGWGKELFSDPDETAAMLAPGEGGIVEIDGIKAGVYKHPNGEIFVSDVRCPHLGCELAWNPDELSWDCPCHGSRFTYKGELINGPAERCLHTTKCNN